MAFAMRRLVHSSSQPQHLQLLLCPLSPGSKEVRAFASESKGTSNTPNPQQPTSPPASSSEHTSASSSRLEHLQQQQQQPRDQAVKDGASESNQSRRRVDADSSNQRPPEGGSVTHRALVDNLQSMLESMHARYGARDVLD